MAINSLWLGEIWGIPSLISIINNEHILLEKSQLHPYVHFESFKFKKDGTLTEIYCLKDLVLGEFEGQNWQSEIDIKIYEKGTMSCITGDMDESKIKHQIETAYDEVEAFYSLLVNLNSPVKRDKRLKKKLKPLIRTIKDYNFTHMLLYKLE